MNINKQGQSCFSKAVMLTKSYTKGLEIMDNPPAVDQHGRKWDPLSMSLSQHIGHDAIIAHKFNKRYELEKV